MGESCSVGPLIGERVHEHRRATRAVRRRVPRARGALPKTLLASMGADGTRHERVLHPTERRILVNGAERGRADASPTPRAGPLDLPEPRRTDGTDPLPHRRDRRRPGSGPERDATVFAANAQNGTIRAATGRAPMHQAWVSRAKRCHGDSTARSRRRRFPSTRAWMLGVLSIDELGKLMDELATNPVGWRS